MSERRTMSRRDMLALMGGAGLTLGMAACSVTTKPEGSSAPEPVPSSIAIPRSGAKLPTGPTSLRWIDSGDLKALFEQPVFDAYRKAHANISVEYDAASWDRIGQVVPLGVRGGTAPDVFAIPQDVPFQVAVNEGWEAPIEDAVPDFQKWKAAFPQTAFVPGVHVFGNHVYSWPLSSSKRYSWAVLYDREYLEKADVDPSARPLTWDEFRAACKKITKQGAGQYYGLMLAGINAADLCQSLAAIAGARVGLPPNDWQGPMDRKTGKFSFTAPELEGAIELLLALKSDGSIFPGFLTLGDADARARMPQRVAAMIFDGPFDLPKWPKADPTYDFGVAMPPVPDSRKWSPGTYSEQGTNMLWLYAKSRNVQVVGDLFSYMGSPDGQSQMVALTQGNLLSTMASVNDRVVRGKRLDAKARAMAQLANKLMRVGPMVAVRRPDASKVTLAMKTVKPSLRDVAQGILSGQITDVKGALRDLQDRSEAALDAAIKDAQQGGAKISRDDWAFANWDPSRDYTGQDYEQLK